MTMIPARKRYSGTIALLKHELIKQLKSKYEQESVRIPLNLRLKGLKRLGLNNLDLELFNIYAYLDIDKRFGVVEDKDGVVYLGLDLSKGVGLDNKDNFEKLGNKFAQNIWRNCFLYKSDFPDEIKPYMNSLSYDTIFSNRNYLENTDFAKQLRLSLDDLFTRGKVYFNIGDNFPKLNNNEFLPVVWFVTKKDSFIYFSPKFSQLRYSYMKFNKSVKVEGNIEDCIVSVCARAIVPVGLLNVSTVDLGDFDIEFSRWS